jgi:hypothetical protein
MREWPANEPLPHVAISLIETVLVSLCSMLHRIRR